VRRSVLHTVAVLGLQSLRRSRHWGCDTLYKAGGCTTCTQTSSNAQALIGGTFTKIKFTNLLRVDSFLSKTQFLFTFLLIVPSITSEESFPWTKLQKDVDLRRSQSDREDSIYKVKKWSGTKQIT
jgi:hypothetical protein